VQNMIGTDTPQMTYCSAYWITKQRIHTQTQNTIACLRQQKSRERAPVLRYRYTECLVWD